MGYTPIVVEKRPIQLFIVTFRHGHDANRRKFDWFGAESQQFVTEFGRLLSRPSYHNALTEQRPNIEPA